MKKWFKILAVLFVIGVIAAILVYVFLYNKRHPDYEKLKPDYTLNAQELYNSYKTNRAGADKLYIGKVIEITGNLSKLDIRDTLVVAIFVFDQGMFGDAGVRCSFLPKYNERAKALQPGSLVRIKGYLTGYNDTDVIMEQCSILLTNDSSKSH